MPSSTWVHSSTIQDLFWRYKPNSLLDVGIGFGRWGFLAREQLDIFRGRLQRSQWKTEIWGIEIFPQYIQSHQHWLYDRIIVEDAQLWFAKNNRRFDVIIAGDVVEHFNKDEAQKLIAAMFATVNKAVIICIPLGCGYPQGETLGNIHESHLSTWEKEEFENDPRCTRITVVKERIRSRPYGIAVMEK